jgi:hypothetical protein
VGASVARLQHTKEIIDIKAFDIKAFAIYASVDHDRDPGRIR